MSHFPKYLRVISDQEYPMSDYVHIDHVMMSSNRMAPCDEGDDPTAVLINEKGDQALYLIHNLMTAIATRTDDKTVIDSTAMVEDLGNHITIEEPVIVVWKKEYGDYFNNLQIEQVIDSQYASIAWDNVDGKTTIRYGYHSEADYLAHQMST